MTPLGSANAGGENFIDYTQIEPLVLEKIIVKAKKLKETRRGGER
jgi:restriction endonuclease Mrr